MSHGTAQTLRMCSGAAPGVARRTQYQVGADGRGDNARTATAEAILGERAHTRAYNVGVSNNSWRTSARIRTKVNVDSQKAGGLALPCTHVAVCLHV